MIKLYLLFFVVILNSSYAQFSNGNIIKSSELNNEFFKIKDRLNKNNINSYDYTELSQNQPIQSSTVNSNFNNILTVSPSLLLNQFNPNQVIDASLINQNFNVINNFLNAQYSQRTCTVPEGTGMQQWNSSSSTYDPCVVNVCNTYYQISTDGLSCELNASELNQKFSELKRYKLISSNIATSPVTVSGTTQTNLTMFSLSGLSTSKKYRVISPTFLRMATNATSTYVALVVDGKQVLYFTPPGIGEISANLDYTFSPTVSNPVIAVNSKSNSGIYLDNNSQIRIDLYEVEETAPQILVQGSSTLAQLDQNFENTELKDSLIQTIGTGETTATVTNAAPISTIATISPLIVGQKYRIKTDFLESRQSSCGTNASIVLKVDNKQIFIFQKPADGWYGTHLDVEFTATATSVPLTLEKGSTSCAAHSLTYRPFNIFKKKTTSDLINLSGASSSISQAIIDNLSSLSKKDAFITRYTRSSNLIPTTGSTYVNANLFTLTGLVVGKKYKIKTPLYIQLRSNSGSAATSLLLNGERMKVFYSNSGMGIFFMQFDYEFIATATSMPITINSRDSGGAYLDADNQIKLDLYEAGN